MCRRMASLLVRVALWEMDQGDYEANYNYWLERMLDKWIVHGSKETQNVFVKRVFRISEHTLRSGDSFDSVISAVSLPIL